MIYKKSLEGMGIEELDEILSENSTLPAKPDRKFWDRFIIDVLEKNL